MSLLVKGVCLKCGTAIPPDDAFCEDYDNTCLSCHTPIPPGEPYCDNYTCQQCQAVKPPDALLCNHCEAEERLIVFLFSFPFSISLRRRANAQHQSYSHGLQWDQHALSFGGTLGRSIHPIRAGAGTTSRWTLTAGYRTSLLTTGISQCWST
jgi:hypothetical protein